MAAEDEKYVEGDKLDALCYPLQAWQHGMKGGQRNHQTEVFGGGQRWLVHYVE